MATRSPARRRTTASTAARAATISPAARATTSSSAARARIFSPAEPASDRLSGGGSRDAFVFDSALGAGNVDRITDFSPRDTIRLSHVVFTAIGATLDAAEFHVGAHAADGDDHIIYDRATGALAYDPDGAGGTAEVEFAHARQRAPAEPRGFRIF